MPNQIIPLNTDPNQFMVVPLNIDGGVKDQFLQLRYNEVANYWVMTITDANGNPLLDSIPFITGNAPAGNILGQFAYMELGSAYIIDASGVKTPDYPNSSDLGTDFVLLWSDTPKA